MSVLAIDIGATKFAVAIVDSAYEVTFRQEIPSIQLWDGLSQALLDVRENSKEKITEIGIGSAGPINVQRGEISPVNIAHWRNFPLIAKIKELFPEAQISMVGDAVALAIAEHAIGAGRGAKNMLGMVVSTGIGGGIIVNNKPLVGDYGNAGYFGHTVVGDYEGGCNCGRTGCVEGYSSGTSMVRYAQKNGGSGEDFVALSASAQSGDKNAIAAIEFGVNHLAKAIINISQIIDLHHVVIGGGVTEAGDIYWKPLKKAVENYSTSLGLVEPIKLLPAQLQRNAGLIGAAMAVGLE
jgi:glucokinase